MSELLYLFELFVENITFLQSSYVFQNKKNVTFRISCEDIVDMVLKPDVFPDLGIDASVTLTFNVGKTILFPMAPQKFLTAIQNDSLHLQISFNNEVVGLVDVPWEPQFFENLRIASDGLAVKPAFSEGFFSMRDPKQNEPFADVGLIVRLSCFSRELGTTFMVKQGDKSSIKQVLVNNDRNTINCERLPGAGSSIFPIGPLYAIGGGKVPEKRLSWSALYANQSRESGERTASIAPDEFQCVIPASLKNRAAYKEMDSKASMCYRPDEKTFMNLKEIRSYHELTADRINRRLCGSKDCPAAKMFKEYGIGPLATGRGLGTLYGDVCPPASYGMSHTYGTLDQYGPYGVFSRPKRLDEPFIPPKNALETQIAPICLNSVKCNEPPAREQQQNPQKIPTCRHMKEQMKNKMKSKCCGGDPLRLKGGGPLTSEDLKGPNSPFVVCKDVMQQFDKILDEYKKALGPCGTAACPYAPNVIQDKCRKLCPVPPKIESALEIQQADELLQENLTKTHFLKAGCGSPRCAYTKYKLNLLDDDAAIEMQYLPPALAEKCGHPKCFYPFESDLPPIHWDCPDPLPKDGCKNPDCPYLPAELRILKKLEKKGPCGSPKCPYALPPPCELPTCPFIPKPCPMKEKKKKEQNPMKRDAVCDNPDCPFADPVEDVSRSISMGSVEICDNPNCPFAKPKNDYNKPKPKEKQGLKKVICENPKCPYKIGNKKITTSPPHAKSGSICSNPGCPYGGNQRTTVCGNPNCPFEKQRPPTDDDVVICENPDCPFAPPKCLKPKSRQCNLVEIEDTGSECSFPGCPFGRNKKFAPNCDNPNCPHGKASGDYKATKKCLLATANKLCQNKACPYGLPKEVDNCDNPLCPFAETTTVGYCYMETEPPSDAQKKVKVCNNPNCPARKPDSKQKVCDNPQCPSKTKAPSAEKKPSTRIGDVDEACDDTTCPYNKSAEICDNPDCPYAKGMSSSEVCDNPECPFAPSGGSDDACENPDCSCDEASEGSFNANDLCSNPECPYGKLSKSGDDACVFPKCPLEIALGEVCENPLCPFAPTDDDICNDPTCPFADPLASCGFPDCSFEKLLASLPLDVPYCPNKNCPYQAEVNRMSGSIQKESTSQPKRKSAEKDVSGGGAGGGSSGAVGTTSGPVTEEKTLSKEDNAVLAKKKKRGKCRGKFVYSMGNKYPGMKVGHKECITPIYHVPPKMGWLWNICTPCLNLKPRRGWRPGAITKTIAARIRQHRIAKGLGILQVPVFHKHGGKMFRADSDVSVSPKPTLQIKKKEGCYWITMNPLKDPMTLAENENPYMECTPMQFKISKRPKCPVDDGDMCCCDQDTSSSSDSELDIEFTPPAGIIHPERFKKKPNVIHIDTQYDNDDFKTKGAKGGKAKKGKKDKKGAKGKGGKKGGAKKGGKKGAKKGKGKK